MSIKSYRGNAYNIEHLNDFHEMIMRMNERGTYNRDDHNLLKQKRKPTDLFMDEDTGYIGPRKGQNTYNTSNLDIGINDD